METLNLIPLPSRIERSEEWCEIAGPLRIDANPGCAPSSQYLQKVLKEEYGINSANEIARPACTLAMKIKPSTDHPESYTLQIRTGDIQISSPTPAGIFHACQTLMQIIHQFREGNHLPCLLIEDSPRFAWRGFMLDEARHFQGIIQVKHILDVMAWLKMNVFHWHLTDDQGWRIEIKRYPRLIEIGSRREGTRYKRMNGKHNGIPHTGYYTQDEIREVIRYAAERHITIVPEIEFPGHATAALAAYPEFGCARRPLDVATHWGIFQDVYCPGKEGTFEFLRDILSEVIELFPGEYIHIGGDEAPKKRWRKCPDCQSKAAELGTDISNLQTWFTNRLVDFLRSNKRRAIGWSEVLQPELDGDVILQHWLPRKDVAVKAIRGNRNLIASPYLDVYLDHTCDLISLKHVYEYDPVYRGINIEQSLNILGVDAPLWTEYIWNQSRLDYQLLPRLVAFAETCWTDAQPKDYQDFEQRLIGLLPWLDLHGISYAPKSEWRGSQIRRMLAFFRLGQPKNRVSSGKIPFPH